MVASRAVTRGAEARAAAVEWTPEAAERLRAIAVPFVRRVTATRVAEAARVRGVRLVDAIFFDRVASY